MHMGTPRTGKVLLRRRKSKARCNVPEMPPEDIKMLGHDKYGFQNFRSEYFYIDN